MAASDGSPFKGFILYAHRLVGDRERPVGEVTSFPEEKAQHSPCVTDEKVSFYGGKIIFLNVTFNKIFLQLQRKLHYFFSTKFVIVALVFCFVFLLLVHVILHVTGQKVFLVKDTFLF